MGGCVVSRFQSKNDASVIDHKTIVAYRKGGPYNVISAPAADDCSPIYRNKVEAGKDEKEFYNKYYNGNLVEALRKTVAKNSEKFAVGIRPLDRIEKTTIEVDGKQKPWEYVHLKPTIKWTYAELLEKVEKFGRGLRAMGATAESRVAIYEDTRAEWLVACYGMWTQGMTGVTVYSSLGEDALEYALREAEVQYVVTNGRLVKNLIKISGKANIPTPTIIYCDNLPADAAIDNAKVHSFAEVLEMGANTDPATYPCTSPSPDNIALIMYTSGTTGDPKGVIMTHGNIHAAVDIVTPRLNMFFPSPDMQVTYIAYLPLAHILEFTAENSMLLKGSYVAYGTPRTLTDATAKPHGDLREFKPHFLCGVPRVYDTVKKAIEAKIPPGLKKRVFETAYEERRDYLMAGKDTPYYNEHVFKNVRETLGGNLCGMLSGGAPMSAKTQEFMRIVSGAEVVQGYGLTETCAITTTQTPGDMALETLGTLMLGTEVKLRDVDEWKHTDKPNPRGEILIRGPCITKGYYQQPEKTAEAFLEGGWFATGDVGEMDETTGNCKIIGRVKALAKNAFGEYVALDALEVVYVLNPLALPNGVCILVNSQKAYICALVLTDESKAMKFARAHNIQGTWPSILENPTFQAEAAKSFAATAKEQGRKPFEQVRHVRVLADEWTPENGVYTAAFKLKRRVVDEKYKDLIAELFKGE